MKRGGQQPASVPDPGNGARLLPSYEVVEVRRHRRIVRLSYLLGQLQQRLGPLYPALSRVARATGMDRRLVPIDLGDIITLFARKRAPTNGVSH